MKGIGESDAGLLSLAREIRRGARSGHPAWRGGVGGRVQRCVPRAMEGDRGINACQWKGISFWFNGGRGSIFGLTGKGVRFSRKSSGFR
jgi:hypothetical protein